MTLYGAVEMFRGSRLCLLLAVLCTSVFSDVEEKCVTFDFGDDFDELFDSTKGQCEFFTKVWTVGRYDLLGIDPPNKLSETFISPGIHDQMQSCTASGNFHMSSGGFIEINVFTENAQGNDQIIVLLVNLNGQSLGQIFHTVTTPGFVPGWQTLKIPVTADTEGYLVLMGMASENSVVLVDSFRYVPPWYDEEECMIYPPEESSETEPPVIDPPETDPPEIDPPETDPPEIDPPETDPPEIDPPETDPPEIDPPETDPPEIDPPETDPPEIDPPETPIPTGDDTESTTKPTIPESDPQFWNGFTIAMVVFITLLTLCLTGAVFYELGKRKTLKQRPPLVLQEPGYNDLPKSMTVPRVTDVYDVNSPYRNSPMPV